ncbi:hypothetical protein NL676_030572 [Syzygium grande]|nr:hypothetical protein NL676_030572 [Syzygium grande]
MEDRGVGRGRESSVADLGSRVRLRRAVRHPVLGPSRFPLRCFSSTVMMALEQSGSGLNRSELVWRSGLADERNVRCCSSLMCLELAETMEDSKDWDDLQAEESEACGVLADMFGQDIHNGGECIVLHDVNIIDDSPQPEENQNFS